MERRKRLNKTSVDFLPTEHSAATKIFDYLNDEDILEFIDEQGGKTSGSFLKIKDQDTFNKIGKTALFCFLLTKHGDISERSVLNHIILSDDTIVTLWADGEQFLSPGKVSQRVKKTPLKTQRHAHGKCSICPTYTIIRNNYGYSDFNNPIKDPPSLPDTAEYAKKQTNEECENCQDFLSGWLCERIDDDPKNIWLLGGSGVRYDIPVRQDGYDIIDILSDDQPPTEAEIADSDLRRIYTETENGDDFQGTDTGEELLFNLIIGSYFYSKFEFDDLILNCKCKEPVEISYELDIVLLDYERQKMVVIETTTSRTDNNKISQKQGASSELKALSTYYSELELEYIYLTTSPYPGDLHRTSGTWLLHQNLDRLNIPFRVASRPDEIDPSLFNTDALPTTRPTEIEESLGKLYLSLLTQVEDHLGEFL